jgi:hypothetical protein
MADFLTVSVKKASKEMNLDVYVREGKFGDEIVIKRSGNILCICANSEAAEDWLEDRSGK